MRLDRLVNAMIEGLYILKLCELKHAWNRVISVKDISLIVISNFPGKLTIPTIKR